MSVVNFSRHDQPYKEYSRWESICPEGTWRTGAPSVLSGYIPDSLLKKTNSVFLMASAGSSATVFMANLNRVDKPASEVDQEPYIIAFDHVTSDASCKKR